MSALGQKRTSNSDRESGFPRKVVSALPPKADMCGAARDVRFGPIADVCPLYSITSSARASNEAGIEMPNAFAVLRLITSSYLDACSTGSSSGFAPLRILSM
jgi:hypothetical protein